MITFLRCYKYLCESLNEITSTGKKSITKFGNNKISVKTRVVVRVTNPIETYDRRTVYDNYYWLSL